ncbi:MAG: hypothetical protein Q8P06_00050 [Candidatus Azambacteria bacterium]|nr:hypothetical protein [Candidatus Azambacteria bacterium]
MILSAKHLPRDLRIFGVISLIFIVIFGIGNFQQAISLLFGSIILFSLAAGVSKKEKWAWLFGVLFFIFLILSVFFALFLGRITIVNLVISLIIPILFLITFIRNKQEIALENKVSVISLTLLLIALIGGVISIWYLSSGGYKQKQEEPKQEQLSLQFCESMVCNTSTREDDGIFYYNYQGKKFIGRDDCLDYCVESLKSEVPEAFKIGTVDWHSYQNEQYGFEVRYPAEYSVKEYIMSNDDYLIMVEFSEYNNEETETPQPYLAIKVYDDSSNIDEWLQQHGLVEGWRRYEESVAGEKAIYLSNSSKLGAGPIFIVPYKDKIFRLENYNTHYFEKILLTFKFLQ